MKRVAFAVLLAAIMAAAAPSCGAHSGTALAGSSGVGGAVLIVNQPVMGKTGGVWLRGNRGWAWIAGSTAAAASAKLLTLAEGDLGQGGETTGSGSVGYVPHGNTEQCRDESQLNMRQIVVEKWISLHNRIFIMCESLQKIWAKQKVSGEKILRCITWILARGQLHVTPGDPGSMFWEWNGGSVNMTRYISGGIVDIDSVTPSSGSWARCAAGN
jgi:hypothetical protein